MKTQRLKATWTFLLAITLLLPLPVRGFAQGQPTFSADSPRISLFVYPGGAGMGEFGISLADTPWWIGSMEFPYQGALGTGSYGVYGCCMTSGSSKCDYHGFSSNEWIGKLGIAQNPIMVEGTANLAKWVMPNWYTGKNLVGSSLDSYLGKCNAAYDEKYAPLPYYRGIWNRYQKFTFAEEGHWIVWDGLTNNWALIHSMPYWMSPTYTRMLYAYPDSDRDPYQFTFTEPERI